jgi:hypothetical protein
LNRKQENEKKNSINRKLPLTERGRTWLAQFDAVDDEVAYRLVNSLTLISHSLFDRTLDRLIRQTKEGINGYIALFAARELKKAKKAEFVNTLVSTDLKLSVDAVARGSDLGSEASVALTIRNICKSSPDIFINHPTVEQMRKRQCDAIVVVDDLLGSGSRVVEFIDALWESRSIRSWLSRDNFQFIVVSYAATDKGKAKVERSVYGPSVRAEIVCPTFLSLPWPRQSKNEIVALCQKYGRLTSKPGFPLGFHDTMASIVFEHGCPNNAPAILWAPQNRKKHWLPLFPDRAILPAEKSAFPLEISRRDSISVLMEAGQARLARAITSVRPPISEDTLLVLAFAARGIRGTGALTFATGLSNQQCAQIIRDCVQWGFLTITHRLTNAGFAELEASRKVKKLRIPVAPKGEEEYYPKMLRKTT